MYPGKVWNLKRLLPLALLFALALPAAAETPRLSIEAPPSLAAAAARVEGFDRARLEEAVRLAGLTDPGPPIRVILAPEDSPEARSVPPWVAGYALGQAGIVVLFPSRSPAYPDRSLEEVLHHEIAHVLIARAARGQPVPRWFNEGVALAAGRAWGIEDRTRFAFESLRSDRVPLAWLERWFGGDHSEASRAYAVSGAFVRDLMRHHGAEVTGEILNGVGGGLAFADAFRRATGSSPAAAEAAFWRRRGSWRRWLPFLTSSLALWMLVTLLALAAGYRRRAKAAELRRRWEQEEALWLSELSRRRSGGDEIVN